MASLKIPGTGMAVTTDLVENIKDIHPQQQVRRGQPAGPLGAGQGLRQEGPRLLGAALQVDEGRGQQDPALVRPRRRRAEVARRQAAEPSSRSPARTASSSLPRPRSTATRSSSQAKEVASPTQVRFGWRNEANPNLVNKEGLPASPFQTNNWQGGTGE